MIGPSYPVDPVLRSAANHTPKGHYYQFTLPMAGSRFYDCTDRTDSKTFPGPNCPSGCPCLAYRNISVYIPAAYQDGQQAGVIVMQDGPGLDQGMIATMDALVGKSDSTGRSLPVFITVSISTGTLFDGRGTLRDIQYDTVSGKYATFVNEEIFPAVLSHDAVKADFPKLRLTSDPNGRATMGCSSGGAAAFSMAWFRPDLFRRVVAYSATLVAKDKLLPSNRSYPLGAWEYHSPPARLIQTTSPRKPLRIFHSVTNRDLGTTHNQPYLACKIDPTTGGQTVVTSTVGCFAAAGLCAGTPAAGRGYFNNTLDPLHSDWVTANNATAVALQQMGYETRFAYALSACHCDPRIFYHDLPNTLVWLWRGWKA